MKGPPDDEDTGVPGLSSWRGVYAFVAAVFLVWLVLLSALTWAFP